MTCGIYSISDQSGNCLYVGLSRDIESRWRSHIKELKGRRHPQTKFSDWFHGNGGTESLVFKVVEECNLSATDVELNSTEIKWFYALEPYFYGKVPSTREQWGPSQETKDRVRETLRALSRSRGVYKISDCPCGISFETSVKNPKKTCSRKCYEASRGHQTKLDRTPKVCPTCGRVEVVPPSTFCSRECSSKSQTTDLPKDRLQEQYWVLGMSLAEIGKLEGVSRQTVYNRMKFYEIPRRDQGEATFKHNNQGSSVELESHTSL